MKRGQLTVAVLVMFALSGVADAQLAPSPGDTLEELRLKVVSLETENAAQQAQIAQILEALQRLEETVEANTSAIAILRASAH